jgi:hypothetical protein
MHVGNHYGSMYTESNRRSDCFIKRVRWLDNGFGLFVRKAFKTGEIITEYAGKLIDVKADKVEDVENTSHYRTLMRIGDHLRIIDGFKEPVEGYGLAQFTNHGTRNNCKFKVFDIPTPAHPHIGVVLVACRPIYPGEELIINYGTTFFTRLNIRPVHDTVRIVHDMYTNMHETCNIRHTIASARTIKPKSIILARVHTKCDILHVLSICILKHCTASVFPGSEETRRILDSTLSVVHDPKASALLSFIDHSNLSNYDVLLQDGCAGVDELKKKKNENIKKIVIE